MRQTHTQMFLDLNVRFHPVSFNQRYDDVVACNASSMGAVPRWLPLFIQCFSLVTRRVCVPLHVSVNEHKCVLASQDKFSVKGGEMRGGDGVRNGQLQHLLLLSSSHFNLSLSFSFQEKCGVCGRVGSAINAGCQKENAGVYTMPLNHRVKVVLLHSPPPRTFFQGGQKTPESWKPRMYWMKNMR